MKILAFITAVFLTVTSFGQTPSIKVIPKPNHIQVKEGTFTITKKTTITYGEGLKNEAELLAASIKKAKKITVAVSDKKVASSNIVLAVQSGAKESYALEASAESITITGGDKAGVFYGTQTLLQLIPVKGKAVVQAVSIQDQPRFGWRGMHLDVGRHFFKTDNIKKFIDQLAIHKMNSLHWHLTEDQGWRIEIKKYPKLTSVGAYRKATPPYGDRWKQDNKPYGGFYTQEEVKDIVAYAKARHITVMPEIDMPGHMAAAIASYPELGNTDVPDYNPEVKTYWGVHPYTLAPKEETFQWIDDVLSEVCELFPSKYIHIGGDEAPKKQWQQSKFAQSVMKEHGMHNEHDLQSYFIGRIEKILEAKGRKLIGWDEIREGGLSPNATMMLWRGWKHALASVNEGHDVVMAPGSHTYFDHYQNNRTKELAKGKEYEAIGGYRPLESVYGFDPMPTEFAGTEKAKHILGAQGQLWSEYMKTWDKVEYMAFPRISALAEVVWTEKENKNYKEFKERLDVMTVRYKKAGINAFDQSTFFNPTPLKGFSVKTNIKPFRHFKPERLIDGNSDSFFRSEKGWKENDAVTISFEALKKSKKVTINTGNASTYKGQLKYGVVEASTDGKTWANVGVLKKGSTKAKLPKGTSAIRVRATKAQKEWVIVQNLDW